MAHAMMKRHEVCGRARTCLLLIYFSCLPWAGLEAADWPTLQGNPQRTGFIEETVGPPPYKVVWRAELPGRLGAYVQPIIAEAKVLLSTLGNAVYALDAETGTRVWRFEGDGPFLHSVAVCRGVVFAACHDRHVYALSCEDGKQIWKYKADAGFWASPCCADGKVFIGCGDGTFYALDQTSGAPVWTYKAGAKIEQTAAFRDGRVTFGAEDGMAYMLDAGSGKELWKAGPFPTLSFRYLWPVFVEKAVVYSPIPASNVPLYYGYARDAKAVGWDTPNPKDISKLPPGVHDLELIGKYLNANLDRQCVYVLNASTGELMPTPPAFLLRATPQAPPVFMSDGTGILAHSGWYWGETSPGFLARIRMREGKVELEDFFNGGPGGIAHGLVADILCLFTGSGNLLFLSSSGSAVFDLTTDRRIEPRYRPTGDDVSLMHGMIPAAGKVFHVSRGVLFCQTTK